MHSPCCSSKSRTACPPLSRIRSPNASSCPTVNVLGLTCRVEAAAETGSPPGAPCTAECPPACASSRAPFIAVYPLSAKRAHTSGYGCALGGRDHVPRRAARDRRGGTRGPPRVLCLGLSNSG